MCDDDTPITLEAARQAKEVLTREIDGAPWLRGIGITRVPAGYAVRVNVVKLTDEIQAHIPPSVNSVPVIVDVVGNIRWTPRAGER